jgi:glycine dehydrogenase subunit 1
MDVSNASLYDGATSVSEAVFMAMRINGRHGNVVVAGSLNPQYQQVLQTYLCQLETNIITIPAVNGVISPADAAAAVNDQTCAVVMQQPNFLGCLEDVAAITEIAHRSGALSILAFDPISPGMLRKPSDYGVDIAVAEGQPLGTPLQFGGPWLGIFTCRSEYVRKMPGRLVGTTTDRNGKPCFVLNLQTREQHIRRDKATSNICTNQGLIALRTAVFLATVGRKGLQQMATLCHRKAQYAAARLTSIPGVELCFQQPFFREFAVRTPISAAIIIRQLAAEGFNVGPDLSVTGLNDIHQPENCFLVAVTEKRTRSEIDELATKLSALV